MVGVGSGVGGVTVFLTGFFAAGAAAEGGAFLLLVAALGGVGAASSAYTQVSIRVGFLDKWVDTDLLIGVLGTGSPL